jgi:putative DNA primase/helicase
MNKILSVEGICDAANGQWADILADLGIDVDPSGNHSPCPVCGGSDRFRFDDQEGRGTWYCNQCEPHAGDGLALVANFTKMRPRDAAACVARVLGIGSDGLTDDQIAEFQQRAESRKAQAEREQAEARKGAMLAAADMLGRATQAVSPYLASKGLADYPAAQWGEETLFPMFTADYELVNCQRVSMSYGKRFIQGGQVTGAFHLITGSTPGIYIVEGVATGISVHLATGGTVYCAMSCGNLSAIAQIVREQCPEAVIYLAGDHDDNGMGQAKAMDAAALIGGSVMLPPELGDWDDYRQAHGLEATRAALLAGVAAPPPPRVAAPVLPDMPAGFLMDERALCCIEWTGSGPHMREVVTPLCQPLQVLAETADETGSESGLLLQWKDRRGKQRQWAMPRRMLIPRNGDDALQILVNEGLQLIDLPKRKKIAEYLIKSRPGREVVCVSRTGWYEGGFVLPHGCIGRDDVLLQSGAYLRDDYTTAGSVDEWREQIAALAVGNSRLAFTLSAAFAAPLLSLVGMPSGGFHLKGESTDGKTTIMLAAASIYGDPVGFAHTWRATGNAIEGIASRRNDALLCLDELGEVNGAEAGSVAYMLANGQGKGRSQQNGELRQRKSWRLLFLSTGELSLEDHAAAAGQRTQAGMEVRTLQIPSDTGKHGAFEVLHGMSGGRELADALRERIQHQHGTAFRAFIEAITADMDHHIERLKTDIKRLIGEMTPDGAGNQVGRAINRFALVAAAGELATRLGVTGWPEGEAVRAVRVCLNAWLAERGHLGNQEDAATLRQIRQFVTAHQFSRFASWHDPAHRPANMVGYRKQDPAFGNTEDTSTTFYVLPEGWREICKGRDPTKAARLAMEAGWIVEHDKGTLQKNVRLPGAGKTSRCYTLSDTLLCE